MNQQPQSSSTQGSRLKLAFPGLRDAILGVVPMTLCFVVMETSYNEDRRMKLHYFSYQPFSVSALSNNNEIRICIQQQDVYTLPYNSYLLMDGKLSGVPTGLDIQLVNNWLAHCFTEIRYLLNLIEVDRLRMPGIMFTIKGNITAYCLIVHDKMFEYNPMTNDEYINRKQIV
ncbi:uncharacterized protein LOC126898044 [Daktulosphaira vitifoliae]|uniref:uncharacterized protein LOC126898044 n=1 Tax=Daktulosphaira vitifoliae TaxID=58002 RepID=UPI0021A9E8A9|nr:uncharacterized protein LOC126898044 [Daktulosphaira vitifoliae]